MTTRDQLAHCPSPHEAVYFFKVTYLEEKTVINSVLSSVVLRSYFRKTETMLKYLE